MRMDGFLFGENRLFTIYMNSKKSFWFDPIFSNPRSGKTLKQILPTDRQQVIVEMCPGKGDVEKERGA